MKGLIKLFIKSLSLAVVLLFIGISISHAAELQKITNAKLINNPANDGDSFFVEADGKPLHIRLYFVDCPETSVGSKNDAQRVREQMRYFGLPGVERTIHFGNEAKIFAENILAKPFTIHTAFASALGRSAKGRIYGFITTFDGDDFASLLVKNGFARTYGIGRETPDGVSRAEMIERLRDLEISAILKRVGIWSECNPDQIAELRSKQRSEDQELKELQGQVKKTLSPKNVLDLNTASKEGLQSIKGIGPVLAERIIAGRPYRAVDDLLKVKGISAKTLEKVRPYVAAGKE